MSTFSRKQCRAGTECQPREFNEAADCLGHHSVRPLPVMAKLVQRAYSYLAKALSPYADQHPLRGDLIVPLTLASADDPCERNYALLDFMEAQVGRVAFVLPQVGAEGDRDALAHTQAAVQEFGELLARVAQAFADGRLTEDEREAIAHEARQLHAAVAALESFVERRAIADAPRISLAAQGGRR